MGLDGVEMILSVEEEFGISISDGDAESMMTARDMIESVCSKLDVGDDVADADFQSEKSRVTCCLSQRAFYKVKSEIMKATNVARGEIQLETSIEELFPKFKGLGMWKLFIQKIGLGTVPWHGSWLSGHRAPRTVRDVVDRLVARNPAYLSVYGRWSRSFVRKRVRQIIAEQLNVSDFDDDAEFVRDLRMD